MTIRGIRLSVLYSFVQDGVLKPHDGRRYEIRSDLNKLHGKTTNSNEFKQTLKEILKDQSMVEFLEKLEKDNSCPGSMVNTATLFVSYAQAFKFDEIVMALHDNFQREDPFIWIDIACINQNQVNNIVWMDELRSAIEEIRNTVLIFPTYDTTYALKRPWCIYELFCSRSFNFRVIMRNNQQVNAVLSTYSSILQQRPLQLDDILSSIDCANPSLNDAKAVKSWEEISKVIKEQSSFSALNLLACFAYLTNLSNIIKEELEKNRFEKAGEIEKWREVGEVIKPLLEENEKRLIPSTCILI